MTVVRGVLLAGGRGRRLGLGVPKSLARICGATLLERALETLAHVSDEIVVAAPHELDLPLPESVAGIPVRRVNDRREGGGPLAGLVAALEAAPASPPSALEELARSRGGPGGDAGDRGLWQFFVLGVDFPLMRPETLVALRARLESRGEETRTPLAVVPAPEGRLQPMACALAWEATPRLIEAYERGQRAMVGALESLEPLVLGSADLAVLPGGIDCFLNLNDAEDRALAERRLREREKSS